MNLSENAEERPTHEDELRPHSRKPAEVSGEVIQFELYPKCLGKQLEWFCQEVTGLDLHFKKKVLAAVKKG